MAFRVINKKTNKTEIVHEVVIDYKRNGNNLESEQAYFFMYDYETGRWMFNEPNYYKPYTEA